jgi:hypothetical protein
MLKALGALLCLGWVICWVIVLIKQFKDGGVVQGIIGLICSLWAFIWGWMNSSRLGIRNIMIAWTIIIILLVLLSATGNLNFSYSVGTPVTP